MAMGVHVTQSSTRAPAVGAPPDDVELLLADADRALFDEGDLLTSRQRFEMAYDVAEHACDPRAMALAALGGGGIWVAEHRTVTGSTLLHARLRRAASLLDPRSSLALRLRIRLAGESDYRSGAHATILAALDEARSVTDPVARAEALNLAHHCLLGPDHGTLRRALALELIGESLDTARRSDLLLGMLWHTVDLFLDADPHAERRLRELQGLLGQEDHLAVGFVASAIEVMLTIRAGRFDEAEELALACARRGAAAGDIDASGWHGAQLVAIRWYQGRLAELLPMLNDLVHSPTLSAVDNSYLAALAIAAAMAGDKRTAAGALCTLRGRDLADLPRSSSWLATMYGVVEAANLLDDADTSVRAYELLRPYGHLPMIGSLGVACFGSVHHALGVASLTTDDVDRAIEHLHEAIQQNLALAHWPAVITSRQRLAEALARRAEPQDAATAQLELATAVAEATALGITLPQRDRHEPLPDATVAFTRQGRSWRIDLGSRGIVVDHSVGMLHLAVLIANPGREIHAIDLVAGVAALRNATEGSAGMSAQPMLDRVATREYQNRLIRLGVEIDDFESTNQPERAARARAERDWLVTELARAAGIGGRVRHFSDSGERARIAVSKSVRRALARITELEPMIGAHLCRTVRTGLRCSYWPT
jgi:hypothetical protein